MKIIVSFFMMFFPAFAFAGFLASGKCWENNSDALAAFLSSYPLHTSSSQLVFLTPHGSSAWVDLPSNPYVTYGPVDWGYFSVTGAMSYNVVSNLYFNRCNISTIHPSLLPTFSNLFDPVLAASYWSFAMTFIFGCWLLAKNAGVIINFIRRA